MPEKYKNVESVQLRRLLKDDLEKPVCEWSARDRDDWKSMGWKLPKCECDTCSTR